MLSEGQTPTSSFLSKLGPVYFAGRCTFLPLVACPEKWGFDASIGYMSSCYNIVHGQKAELNLFHTSKEGEFVRQHLYNIKYTESTKLVEGNRAFVHYHLV